MSSTGVSRIAGVDPFVTFKAPCKAAATTNITLSGEQTISGVACVTDDRVLLTGQTNPIDNGIWLVSTAAWTRATDFNGSRDVVCGTIITIATASVASGTMYVVTTANPIVIGTTSLTIEARAFVETSGQTYASMEALRLSTDDYSYVETSAFYASGTTGGAKLYRDGTGTPTGSGAAVIAAALAAGTFCNAAGVCYKLHPDIDVTAYMAGVDADGVDDCSDVIEDFNTLRELPAGKVAIGSTVTIGQARYIAGRMPPGTTPQSSGSTQTYIQHDFDGTAFDFVGTANDLEGAGGGLKDISIIQNHGNGTGESGIAVRAVATASTRPNWLKIENVNIEEVTGKNGWEYGIYIDGTAHANSIRNIWIDRCRFVAGALATKAVSLRGVANAFVNACMGNLVNGDLEITGGSASVFVNDSTFAALDVDNAQNVYVTGGSYESITTTSNTTNAVFMTAVSNGIPTLAGSRNYFCGLDIANSRYLFYSSASPFVFFVPGGVTEFVGNNAVANDAQILLEGRYNGYGAGVRAVSRTSSGGTRVNMGRLTWQGTAAWDTTAANQDSKAVVSVTENGTETDVAEFRVPGSGETGMLLLHDGSIKRVTVGAADSGGTGHRLLRVTN